MNAAIAQAEKGIVHGHGGPFGAVVIKDGKIVGRGHNMVIGKKNPTLHGEIMAIADACRHLGTHDLSGCDMYTTSEPCPMCLCATMWANIRNTYYGCTLADNDRIGFRDERFRSVLNINYEKIKNLHELDRDACLALFDRYNHTKGKKTY